MEEKIGGHKPLRKSSNKIKDLYDTYIKNDERVIPITDADNITNEENETVEITEQNIDNVSVQMNDQELEELRVQIDTLIKEKDDFKDQLMRKAAELENIRRRSIKEKQEMLEYANERLLFKMLEILDDINSAVDAGKKSTDFEVLLKGMEMIQQKTAKLFAESGVAPMENASGKPFDVNFHEAMMHIPSDEPEGNVVQTLQNGYMIHDKVLRHARVITSAGKPESEA